MYYKQIYLGKVLRVWLIKYCFFDTTIEFTNKFIYNQIEFDTFEKAEKFMIAALLKECEKFIKDDDSLIFNHINYSKYKLIKFCYTKRCDNIGHGKYISNRLWKNYQWIQGIPLNTSRICNYYSIRFDENLPEDEVLKKGIKIVKKHCRKFIKEFKK